MTHKPQSLLQRLRNSATQTLIWLGVMPPQWVILTVVEPETDTVHEMPVLLLHHDNERWLVAPDGGAYWVSIVRAAGRVTLSRRGQSVKAQVEDVTTPNRADVLKTYLNENPRSQKHFTARPDAPVEAFTAEAEQHPVFLLTPQA